MTNIYRCTPRILTELATDALMAGLVPMIEGSPGTGKSQITHQIAETHNLELIDHRVSTSAPEDFTGLPNFKEGKAHFAPFEELFPLESTPLPPGKDGWLLFLDEFNSGAKMVQAAAYKLLLDRKVGQHNLHPRCAIMGAGNLITDNAIVNKLGTALQSRMCWLELEVSFNDWLRDVATKRKYDPRIIAYLSYDEQKLMNFRPDHDDKTFDCPRTWEFMNNLIKDKEFKFYKDSSGIEIFEMERKLPLYAGTISSGTAANFVAFCALQRDLVTIKEILNDPVNADVPASSDRRWIVISHLMGKVDAKNFADLCTYVNRFDVAFKILFFRGVTQTDKTLRTHPAFVKAMIELDEYLKDD